MIIKNHDYRVGAFRVYVFDYYVKISSSGTILQQSPYKVALLDSFISFGYPVLLSFSCNRSRSVRLADLEYDFLKNSSSFDVTLCFDSVLVSPKKSCE